MKKSRPKQRKPKAKRPVARKPKAKRFVGPGRLINGAE